MATYYLVDMENTGAKEGLMLSLNSVKSGDVVICFSTCDSKTNVSCELLLMLQNRGASFLLKKTFTGKNALDFQLSSWLGHLIAESGAAGKDNTYVIVSNDAGYDPLESFWAQQGIKVNRLRTINASAIVSTRSENTKEECMQDDAELKMFDGTNGLPELSDDEMDGLRMLIPAGISTNTVMAAYKSSKTKCDFNIAMNKTFKNGAKVHEMFKYLNPVWKKYGF